MTNANAIPNACREYEVELKTGAFDEAEADSDVFITINGSKGNTGEINISETSFQRNAGISDSSCKIGEAPVSFVRFDKEKKISTSVAGGLKVDNRKNASRFVTINAQDVGTVGAVVIRHNTGRFFLDYVNIKSNGEYYYPFNRWFTPTAAIQSLRPVAKPILTDYKIRINTGDGYLAGTDANIYLTIEGENGIIIPEFNVKSLMQGNPLERGQTDTFTLKSAPALDQKSLYRTSPWILAVRRITVRTDNSGSDSDWLLNWIEISSPDACSIKNSPFKDCVANERYSFNNWLNKTTSSVTLEADRFTYSNKTITFRNESTYKAKMRLVYLADTMVSGQKISLPKVIETPEMLLAQNSTFELPNLTANSKIQVFIIGNGTNNNNFYTTQIDANFTGNKCFKAYATALNPNGGTCN